MEENKDLGTEAVESPSTVEANVNESENQTVYEQFWDKNDDVHATSEESPDNQEQPDSVETVVNQNEGTIDNNSGSTQDETTEAEELTSTEEGEHPEGEETKSESESVVEFDEMRNHVFEIGGKRYKAEDLKSILGQEESAGTKSREASEALKDIKAQKADLAEREEAFTQRNDAAIASDEMVRIQSEARQVNAKLQKARKEHDAFEITLAKDRLDELEGFYDQAKIKMDKQDEKDQDRQEAVATAGYEKLGLGYLVQDGPAANAFTKYIDKRLSPQEAHVVTMVPNLGEMAEKARKYDIAMGKKGVKLKTSDTTLKTGSGESVSSKKSNEEIARRKRMAQGRGTKADIKQASSNAAKGFWDE